MKKYLALLLLVAMFLPVSSVANNPHKGKAHREHWEKFQQDKHDFMKEKMCLTEEQAAQFFPLYDEMESKKFELMKEVRREAHQILESTNVTEEQYKAAADRAASLPERQVAIEKEYYERFCEILTPQQQFLYHRCQVDFQRHVLHKKHHNKK